MRSSLAAARRAIVARSRSWLRRRQGADADPVPLHRRILGKRMPYPD
jgi:hypothetical protein